MGVYIVPLRIAREFSGHPISTMNNRFFSLGASSPSGKHIYESDYVKTCMFLSPKCKIFHLPLVYLKELCENWCI